MKKTSTPYPYWLVGLSLCTLFAFSTNSTAQNCPTSTAVTELNTNNVRALLQCSGDFWWDGSDAGYFFPNDDTPMNGPAAIFAGGLWMGGLDPGGNLKLAAAGYGRANGQMDYWPGPLNETGTITNNDCANYDRFWQVNGAEIDAHRADWADNGQIDDPVPNSILGWAGRGNPHFQNINGFELPVSPQPLAPFRDINSNGIYDPMNGDYPDINNADQGIWWVFNDAGGIHLESNGAALQFEIQVLAYAYASNEAAINNTTFYDFKFINRAVESIDSTYIGLWADPDLGCYTDDLFGSDPANNLAYVYNEDAVDGNPNCQCDFGIATYCEEVPMLAIKVMEGTKRIEQGQLVDNGLAHFMYYLNSDVGSPPAGMTAPSIAPEFYNFLTGSWRDGTPLTYGGSGYTLGSPPFVNHAFSDAPNNPNGWSMCSENLPAGDRRMILSSGPFSLSPGGVNSMTIAVLMVPDVPHPCPDLAPLQEACQALDNFYNTITNTDEPGQPGTSSSFMLFPNPMQHSTRLELRKSDQQISKVELYAANGQLARAYEQINATFLNLERENLNGGLYFLRMYTVEGQQLFAKLLIQ